MTYTARDIATVFESIAPLTLGIAGDELGFIHGTADAKVTGLACLWQANAQSIAIAANAKVPRLTACPHQTMRQIQSYHPATSLFSCSPGSSRLSRASRLR